MMLAHNNYYNYYPVLHQRPHHQQQYQQQQQPSQRRQLSHQQPQIQQSPQHFQQFQQADFSALNQPSFSTTNDDITNTAAAAIAATERYNHTRPATSNAQGANSMPSDSWMSHGRHTPRQTHRLNHQRDSSLSSVGSNTPVSPYNANTTNPRIAVNDTVGDGLHEMAGITDGNYTFNVTKSMTIPDAFYTSGLSPFSGHSADGMDGNHIMGNMNTADGLPALVGTQQRRQGGLAPVSDMPVTGSSTKSRPISVASSIGGDSPATPPIQEHEDDHRRTKNAFAGANMPKLDRTITDVYSDELYNPSFSITSTSPSPQTQPALSPASDVFKQRIQAANSQHLYAAQSPMLGDSRGRSPFRQDSPYAAMVNEIPKPGTNRVRLETSQQLRERRKAEEDAKQLQHHQQQQQQQQSTPTTISPKDALLEFNESEVAPDFPLFPSQEPNTYGGEQNNGNGNMNRVPSQQSASPFPSMSTTPVHSNFNFSAGPQIPIPQTYTFMSRQRPQHEQQQQQRQLLTPSFPRMGSAEASHAESDNGNDSHIQRPDRTAADSGTYTCTYHGCTLRFATPALLQKHKREGHRQVNALNHLRGQAGIGPSENSVANSQAGPHRCDRINPSTGKPCNGVFSRPYDLTRHEDTIHNARKQKVRCDLCTEEKTFSRADALTRHYRVCHPEVEVPGKHRKRISTMGA